MSDQSKLLWPLEKLPSHPWLAKRYGAFYYERLFGDFAACFSKSRPSRPEFSPSVKADDVTPPFQPRERFNWIAAHASHPLRFRLTGSSGLSPARPFQRPERRAMARRGGPQAHTAPLAWVPDLQAPEAWDAAERARRKG